MNEAEFVEPETSAAGEPWVGSMSKPELPSAQLSTEVLRRKSLAIDHRAFRR